MAISLDTSMLAAIFDDGSLELWNVKQGRMQGLIGPQQSLVQSIAFSLDGTMLATGSSDGQITLWSTADGKQRNCFQAHHEDVLILAFSHDGRRVASADEPKELASVSCSVKVWDISQGKLEHAMRHPVQVISMAFSPDGQKLAFSDNDYTLKIWDLSTWKDEATFDWSGGFRMRFSPDSTMLVVGWGSQINLFQIATGELLHQIWAHQSSVNSVTFLNERIELAVAYDIEDNFWVSRNGERVLYLPIDYKPEKVCVQGNLVALGTRDHGVVVLEFLPDIDTKISV
jgi:WD40 repeat protein